MRPIDHIVIHCSDTPNGRHVRDFDVDRWHRERGFQRSEQWRKQFNPGLSSIGYHFLIDVNGALFTGRALEEVGAHVRGYNSRSIGICMAGRDRFTGAQWLQLAANVRSLQKKFPAARVVGHRDLDPKKRCPCFDVAGWLSHEMRTPDGALCAPEPIGG